MIPCHGYFLASLVLGEKAVETAHHSGLPDSVLDVIDGTKAFAEGKGVRFEIRSAQDVHAVEKLAAVKMTS